MRFIRDMVFTVIKEKVNILNEALKRAGILEKYIRQDKKTDKTIQKVG